MSPRVAFLTTARDIVGGAEEGMLGILRHYPPTDLTPVVIAPAGGEIESAVRERNAALIPWNPDPLPLGIRPRKIRPFLRGLRRGAGELTEQLEGFALITTHSIEGHLFGAECAARLNLPLVWHVRDVHQPAGERLALRLMEHRGHPQPLYLSRAARARSPLTTDGPVIGDGLDRERMTMAPTASGKAQPGDRKDRFTLAYVGQVLPRKGLNVLLDAVDRARAAAPEIAGTLDVRIVGEGPERPGPGFLPDLRRRVEEMGLEAVVTFEGRRRDIPAYLETTNALVLPSTDEALGLVVLEAMAAGKPVIGCADAGIAEPVRDSIEGLLVPPEDTEALAEAILQLARDPERTAAMGAAGRERVATAYDAKPLARRQAAFHASCLSDRTVGESR